MDNMTEHEDKTVSSFILKEKRHRYRYILTTPKKRSDGLDRLNHCADLDPKYATWVPSNADIVGMLRKDGSPEHVYLIADSELDGTTLPLAEAVEAVAMVGWGTIVSCIPGHLAYYYDECGERRAILRKKK
jgi:hypothetical protein